MDVRSVALQGHGFIEQHRDSERFDVRHHAKAVVIAEDGVHRPAEVRADLGQRGHGGLVIAVGFGSKVAGQHAGVISRLFDLFDERGRVILVHVQMEIA